MREKYLSFLLFLLVAAGCRDSANKNAIKVMPGVGYSNGTAEQQMVSLPDGSRITIGSGTTIVPSKGFGKEDRDLDIDGSGMLEVAAGEKPFVVLTGNLVIAVLDTTGASGAGGSEVSASGEGGSGPGGSGAGALGVSGGGWKIRFVVDAVRKRPGEEVDLLDGRLRVTKSYHSDTDSLPEELTAGDMVMINREIDLMEKEKMTGPEVDKVKEKYHLAAH
jgi:transmembrane sensor